jgi:hypothetical protein
MVAETPRLLGIFWKCGQSLVRQVPVDARLIGRWGSF